MIEIPCQFVAVGDEELPFVQCNIQPPAVGTLVFVAGKPEAWQVVSVQLQWADDPAAKYPLPQMWIVALKLVMNLPRLRRRKRAVSGKAGE